ncbi:MAG: hypothetical protein ACTHOI_12240 [Sphingomicrobium sp.]
MITRFTKKPASEISVGARAVAIFDVLGVKEEILSGRAAQLIERYQEAVTRIDRLREFEYPDPNIPRLFPVGAHQRLLPSLHIFSDTLILIAPDQCREATLAVLIQSWRLMQAFMTARMPLRGGITFGQMHIDSRNRLHVGPALTSAHLIESSQAWAGCVVDESVVECFAAADWAEGTLYNLIFPRAKVPFKRGSRVRYEERRVVNWRCNLMFDRGLCVDLKEAQSVSRFKDLHPYLRRALRFGRAHKYYPRPAEQVPVECRVFWVGKNPPPFENGDNY